MASRSRAYFTDAGCQNETSPGRYDAARARPVQGTPERQSFRQLVFTHFILTQAIHSNNGINVIYRFEIAINERDRSARSHVGPTRSPISVIRCVADRHA
jgi:hypothetical protein